FCDQARVAQMIGNLLHNASKYTHDGGKIVLSAELHGDAVRISVADDGIGMEAATLDGVFDMFNRTGSVSGRMTEGLGIGLSIVRAMAQLHNGTVSAFSEGLGRGSCFVLDLPIVAQTSEVETSLATAVES